jgi:hypothetical protein
MKKILLTLSLCCFTLSAVAADALDDALKKYAAMNEGRIRFVVSEAADQAPTQNATLAFRRPSGLHFSSYSQPAPETHVWLENGKLWMWTSQWGPGADSQRNAYVNEEHAGPLSEVPNIPPLGPANFLLRLLSGNREAVGLDSARQGGFFTLEGDQLIFDSGTGLLREIVAYRDGKLVGRAAVQHDPAPVTREELGWKLPAGATEYRDPSSAAP